MIGQRQPVGASGRLPGFATVHHVDDAPDRANVARTSSSVERAPMGMYGTLRRVTLADAERLRADQRALEWFLFGQPPIVVEDRLPGIIGFLLRFTPIKVQRAETAPPSDNPLWPPAAPGEQIYLDKAWHGLHFLLTGADDGGPEPACYLLTGGEHLSDDDDVQARLLRPEQVRALAEYLATIDGDELTRRFDPERMMQLEIYPEIWTRPEETDAPRKFLFDAFSDLREFVDGVARDGDAIVVCIS